MKLIMKIGIGVGVVAFICLLFVAMVLWHIYLVLRTEAETHLIPDGYRGPVVIVYDMPNGDSVEYENGRRILRIPPNGLLYTKFKRVEGFYDPGSLVYYYVHADGSRTTLPHVAQKQDISDSTNIYIFDMDYGELERKGREKDFDQYSVGTLTDDSEEYTKRANRMIRGK